MKITGIVTSYIMVMMLVLVLGLAVFYLSAGAALAAEAKKLVVVVLGDSLVAGYQLAPGDGFVEVLQNKIDPDKKSVEFINAGVSGDTTAGGLARLDWSVPDNANGVILELGANDALRGLSPAVTKDNLEKIIAHLQQKNITVFLIGMLAPPNMGKAYGEEFNAIYPALASAHNLPFYPFFLDGVAGIRELNLDDGMHPNREGVNELVKRIEPNIQRYVEAMRKP